MMAMNVSDLQETHMEGRIELEVDQMDPLQGSHSYIGVFY